MKKIVVLTCVAIFSLSGTALAQSPTPSSSASAAASPSISPTIEAEAVTETETVTTALTPVFQQKSKASPVWLKFRRFLTPNQTKRSELTLAIANLYLAQAQEKTGVDDTAGASRALDRFNEETATLQKLVDTVSANTTDQKVKTFLDTFLADRTEQYAVLESLDGGKAGSLANKITNLQTMTLRDIVKVSSNPKLTEEQKQARIEKILAHYQAKHEKTSSKIEALNKEVGLLEKIDDATDDDTLEAALEEHEDDLVQDASAKLDKNELAGFAQELRRKDGAKSMIVLQKILDAVPEASKSGIETALDALIVKHMATFSTDSTALESFLDSYSGSEKINEKLLERVKERSDEPLKQKIEAIKTKNEKLLEAQKKQQEKAREAQKKAGQQPEVENDDMDDEDEKQDEQDEKQTQTSPSPKPTPSTTSSTQSSTQKAESTSLTIKLNEKGQLEKTSYTSKKNSRLTIQVESEYTSPVTVTLSNGKSLSVSKGQKKSFEAFSFENVITFEAGSVSGSIAFEN